jgi:hypothetical protein
MATESIRERIVQHVETSLSVITGTGEYHTAVATIARGQAEPSNLDELPAIRITEGEETVREGNYPCVTRWLSIQIRSWARVDPDLPDVSLPTVQNRLQADIERALLADPTRGGVAITTNLMGSVPNDDEARDETGSVTQEFQVQYQTLRADPASLG